MNKKVILNLFICLSLVQIAVPASMIHKWETTLREGRQYRFRTAPVDPYDPFRGRYVALRLQADSAPAPRGEVPFPGQKVYAILNQDEEGFARIAEVSLKRPQGDNFIQASVSHANQSKVYLKLPFDRYYAEEKTAPAIERSYRRYSRMDLQDAYITVRIKSGVGVLEELYIKDMPVLEFLRKEAATSH